MIGNYLQRINKLLVLPAILILTSMPVFADSNTFGGLEISQNPDGIYNILLKTENSSYVKAIRTTANKLTLLVKSTLPADSVEISYNNAPELNNVIVQKRDTDKTLIVLEGNSVQNATVNELILSDGTIKENAEETGLLNGYSPFNDKKLLSSTLLSLLMAAMLFVTLKPKQSAKNKAVDSAEELRNAIKNANTLRKKNKLQSKNIPSINYKVNGYVSVPQGFVINEYKKERIKKAG